MVQAECDHCGDRYYVRPSKVDRSRYCRQSCMHDARKNRTECTCERCGDSYEVKASRADETRFCSRSCKDAHKRQRPAPSVTVTCARCGEDVERIPHEAAAHDRHFCDDECRGAWLSEHWRGAAHPNYRGGPNHEFGDNWLPNRETVLERDSVCQRCGEDGSNTFLDVHHSSQRRVRRRRTSKSAGEPRRALPTVSQQGGTWSRPVSTPPSWRS